jgi:hypothetical protein
MPVELIVEAATKLGIEAVKKFFEGKKDEKDLISIGLAVGYFYNFLNVISGVIRRNQLTLYEKTGDKDGRHFARETVGYKSFCPRACTWPLTNAARMSSGKQRRASSFLRRNKAGCTESTTISSSVVTNQE